MDTFAQMIAAVQSDLSVNNTSVFTNLTAVKLAINRARRKAEGLHRWPSLEDAQKTSTENGKFYYDYPQRWRPDSIWKIWVDSDDNDYGNPLDFEDYLYEKENDQPSGKSYFWANFGRRFFVYPTPTSNGSNNIEIWGIKTTADLEADGDTTIFSYNMPEVNEAIVLEAETILKTKGEQRNSGEMLSNEAKNIVAVAWNRLKQDKAKEEKTQPLLDVEDMFKPNQGGRKDTNIGKFN